MTGFYTAVANKIPQIKRGRVWCTTCGHSQSIAGEVALRKGWPTHCGYTMTIDSPEERAALANRPATPVAEEPNTP